MATTGCFQTGSLSNQSVCQTIAKDYSTFGAVSGTQYGSNLMILAARYHITAGAGVSSGTATLQELGADGTWRNMAAADVPVVQLTAAGEYSGAITGPFHGLRIALSTLVGGVVTFAEIICGEVT